MYVYTVNFGNEKMSQFMGESGEEFKEALMNYGDYKSVELQHNLNPFYTQKALAMFKGVATCITKGGKEEKYEFTEFKVPEGGSDYGLQFDHNIK